MSAHLPTPRQALAELLMSAATELTAAAPAADVLAPLGIPVIRGRLNLGLRRPLVTAGAGEGRLAVVAGLRTACWLGPLTATPPDLGRIAHRGVAEVDPRGRVVLDRRARAWLDVADPAADHARVGVCAAVSRWRIVGSCATADHGGGRSREASRCR